MARLWYPDEAAARIVISTLTEGLADDGLRMRLRGNDGRERLLSALDQPRWSRYRSLPDKAAALHFFLNKGHPLVDGNKRFAVAATDTFLYINGADFFGTDSDVVNLALGVADGTVSLKALTTSFRARVFRIAWSNEETVRRIEKLQEVLGFDGDSILNAFLGCVHTEARHGYRDAADVRPTQTTS